MKSGDFQAINFAGSQAGYDAAIAYVGSNGVVCVYPGADTVSLGTIGSGVTVLVYEDGGFRVAGTGINLRDAVKDGNGTTDPALYSDKTLDLSTTSNGQAAKSVDIVSRFTSTTSSTGLSLNGLHSINRYGASGSGGGDFATGLAVGAYSEHRGDAAVTGAIYGAENASTMYNTGSVVSAFGSLNTAQITTGANAAITTAIGARGIARFYAGAGTITTAIGISGIAGTEQSATGTITDAIGAKFEHEKSGGTITNATGVYITSPTQGATNNFGLRVAGTPSGGSNLNQAVRVDSGSTYLGGSLAVGGQAASLAISSILCATATLDFDLSAVTIQDKQITVSGAALGDSVFIGVPNGSVTTTVQFTGWVSATNTVTIRATTQATGENPASGTFRATVFHY